MQIEALDQAPKGWDEFVINHPEGRIYQLTKWNEIVCNTFNHSNKYLQLNNSGNINAILPLTEFNSFIFGRYSISLPFINYGGLLATEDRYIYEISDYLNSYRKNSNFNFVELRMDKPLETSLTVRKHKVTFLFELPDNPDDLWNSFKAKLRSQIRRPLKEDMVAASGNLELLDDFYRIFSINMRDLGTPALPKKFFENILMTFPENSKIVCVYTNSKLAAAASFLIYFKDACEIPWASSLSKYNMFSPNMLLYWESLKFAIEQNLKVFDFGRCSPDGGTYRFKKQWGAEEKQLYWYYQLPEHNELPELNPRNPKYDLAIKIWKKAPLFLTNYLGPKIIKNIP